MQETLFRRQVSILFALITRLFSIRRWLLKTIRHYSQLFVIIRRYSHCSYYLLFATICYSRLFAIRYSGFPDTRVILNIKRPQDVPLSELFSKLNWMTINQRIDYFMSIWCIKPLINLALIIYIIGLSMLKINTKLHVTHTICRK